MRRRLPLGDAFAAHHRQAKAIAVHAGDTLLLAERALMQRAKKLHATQPPAGIYGKVLLVRASRTGAAAMAMTLAEDPIACHASRASLWPAEVAT